jgi:hypothetical protein
MHDLIQALTVPFVAGFIVQRFLEILDPITVKFIKDANTKKIVLGLVSLAIGCALCGYAHITIFHELSALFHNFKDLPFWLDVVVSGIFVSAGTEGFNSLLKFANYKKEASKGDAGDKIKNAGPDAIKAVNPQQ